MVFEAVATPDLNSLHRVPGSVTELPWQIEPWLAGSAAPHVAAYYQPIDSPADPMTAPPLGRQLLRGAVFGTKHAQSVDDLFPTVSATVSRIQVFRASSACKTVRRRLYQAPPG